MTHHPRLVWLLAGCWIAISLALFLVIDASSTRSWFYLAAVALGPPVVLLRLWPQVPEPTADDVIHGRGGRS
jgi:hypothetical protein